jgi:hypothetical protein
MKISAYLIMDDATLPEASAEVARKAGGEWVIVNKRNGRQLVSCLAPTEMIPALMQMLTPYHPSLVGVWDLEGMCLSIDPAQILPYIDVMPDLVTSTGADTPATLSRPTVARDVCFWAGWGERCFA